MRTALTVIAVVVGCAALLALMLVVLEWHPAKLVATPVTQSTLQEPPAPPDRLTLLTWNLGYAALDSTADFFMDGGREVRPAGPDLVRGNLAAQAGFLRDHPADVVLLQEVDRNSSRSFHLDEAGPLIAALPGYAHAYAPNFRVRWIPYPFLQPLGRVESGLLSLVRYPLSSADRRQLPGAFPWPVRTFHLKRCLHELRFPAADGHDWVVVNLHLSTFDQGGRLRRQEMAYLRDLLRTWQQQGDHVIVGGDWNQAFPGVEERLFPASSATAFWYQSIPADWAPPGWRWAFDRTRPSLRATDRPYEPGINFLTIMDGFLVGPEISVISVQTTDLHFAHSDHQPVQLEVEIR